MNADFEDEYGRRMRQQMHRKHFRHGCLYPVAIAVALFCFILWLTS
jgi:hypothetical protein